MALFILPLGSRAVASLRAVPAATAITVVTAVAAVALLGGTALGYQLASARSQARTTSQLPALDSTSGRVLTERIGALQGKLVRLESAAVDLARRVGKPAATSDDTSTRSEATALPDGPAGGPFEPLAHPSRVLALIERLERGVQRVEGNLELIADGAAVRNLARMAVPSRMPVAGTRISSGFGRRIDPLSGQWARHTGIDLPAPSGTPVVASAGGRVSFAGYRPAYGNTVEIDHGNGLKTRYAHARRLAVRRGELVLPGQVIASVGSTGRSTGPHLHFEVLRHGRAVEPRQYLARAER